MPKFLFYNKICGSLLTMVLLVFLLSGRNIHALNTANMNFISRILSEHPNGWVSMRDAERFFCDMDGACNNGDSDSEDNINNEELEEVRRAAINAVDTMYERTARSLNGNNNNLLLSFLYKGIGNEIFCGKLTQLIDDFANSHKDNNTDKNKFLRDSLWSIQYDAMHKSTRGNNKHENFSYALIYQCINLSSQDEKFILDTIIPEMKQCGFGTMIPYPYKDK